MDRLTEKVFGFVQLKACGNDFCKETCAEHDEEKSCKNCHIQKAFEKLAEYEDLEEQGLLLRLPCKVGDILYYPEECFNIVIPVRLNEIVMSFVGLDTYSFQYNCCSFDECGDVYEDYEFDKCDINKTVFLTKAEAEQKLKETESD